VTSDLPEAAAIVRDLAAMFMPDQLPATWCPFCSKGAGRPHDAACPVGRAINWTARYPADGYADE
jgi:hypothetical protein